VLSAFPLGGFVKMFGENQDDQEIDEEEQNRSFAHKPVWQRFLIVLAGPLFNFFFSLFLFFMVFAIVGLPTSVDTTRIGRVTVGSPAEKAGVVAGDTIREINGQPTDSWMDVLNGVKSSEGLELSVAIERDGKMVVLKITPRIDSVKDMFGEEVEKRFMIGIVKADELTYTRVGILDAVKNSFAQTWMYISLTMMGFVKIFQRVIPASELGGPILIAQIAGEQMKAGWLNLVYFMGLLSVNLGFLNLLPIPVLDGGHLVFLSYEGIMKKPLNEKAQIFAQQVGIGILGTLMIFVFYNDIARLFSR
jgi:regulator of sigma E protease